MGSRPSRSKLRVVLRVDGIDRQVMSFREAKDGSLIVHPIQPDQGYAGPFHGDMEENRISIHPSSKSAGITVKQHIRNKPSNYHQIYSHILPRRRRVIWPVICYLCPNLRADKYKVHGKNSDVIVNFGSYDPANGVAGFLIVVDTDKQDISLPKSPFIFKSVDFKHFRIHIGCGFLVLPSCHFSFSSVLTNYPSKLNGIDNESTIRRPTLSLSPKLLGELVSRLVSEVGFGFYRQTYDWMASEGKVTDQVARDLEWGSQRWSRLPLNNK